MTINQPVQINNKIKPIFSMQDYKRVNTSVPEKYKKINKNQVFDKTNFVKNNSLTKVVIEDISKNNLTLNYIDQFEANGIEGGFKVENKIKRDVKKENLNLRLNTNVSPMSPPGISPNGRKRRPIL